MLLILCGISGGRVLAQDDVLKQDEDGRFSEEGPVH
jgi:hypothetical protein